MAGDLTIFLWMLFAAFLFMGMIGMTILGIGAFIGLLINLVLLPLRIVLWIIKGFFGLF
jgi:hypothetical protein